MRAAAEPVGEDLARDGQRDRRALRQRDRDGRGVEPAVLRLRVERRRRRPLGDLRRAEVVLEALRRVGPERVLSLRGEPREQRRDVPLVLERRVQAAELVERPVTGVESRQKRPRRGGHTLRERACRFVAGRLRVLRERQHGL